MTTSKKQPSPKTELIKFNKSIVPFHIFDHENGLYSLCLHEGNKYEKTFHECRKTPNDPEGNGYDFEALIKKFISEKMPDEPFNQIIGSTPVKISFLMERRRKMTRSWCMIPNAVCSACTPRIRKS